MVEIPDGASDKTPYKKHHKSPFSQQMYCPQDTLDGTVST